MVEYINISFYKSEHPLSAEDLEKYNSLFENDKGIEKVDVAREEIYIEFNTYSKLRIAELLTNHGFIFKKDQKPGFVKRQIQLLAKRNSKYYGNRNLACH